MARKRWIERRRAGRGFRYVAGNRSITDPQLLAYCRSLAVPPAWQQVQIAANKNSTLLATGIDAAGRRQYIYHPRFRKQQDQLKFDRLIRFARSLPRMRRTCRRHLAGNSLDKQKVLASITKLLDETYCRVGNTASARQHHYGVTTLRSKHLRLHGPAIVLRFSGKSGQPQQLELTSRLLASILKQLDKLPGHHIFRYRNPHGSMVTITSADVNTYIKQLMGEEFSTKDFRTWGGTCSAARFLARQPTVTSLRDRRKIVAACVRHVAGILGNTPAVTRQAYIDPWLLERYMQCGRLPRPAHSAPLPAGLRAAERQLLAALEARPAFHA